MTSAQTGITTITDLTSLTVTVTVPAGGRRIKITGFVTFVAIASTSVQLTIREGASTLQLCGAALNVGVAGDLIGVTATYSVAASSGAHTYKLSAASTFSAISTGSAGTAPSFILVEGL